MNKNNMNTSYRKSLGNQMNSAENLAHRENNLNRFVDIQKQMLLVQQNMQQNVLGLQKQMLDLQADFIKPLLETTDSDVDESIEQPSEEVKASTSNAENVEKRPTRNTKASVTNIKPAEKIQDLGKKVVNKPKPVTQVVSSKPKETPIPNQKVMRTRIVISNCEPKELIEEGKCVIPVLTKRSRTTDNLRESYKAVYSILRSYRHSESPTGGSGYALDKQTFTRKVSVSAPYTIRCHCYARKKVYECPVQLRIEYNLKSMHYRLYRIGTHNHQFDNVETNWKWDRILDKEGEAIIEVIRQQRVGEQEPNEEDEHDEDIGETYDNEETNTNVMSHVADDQFDYEECIVKNERMEEND